MQHYELMYVLPPTLTEEEVPQSAEKISNLIQDSGAEIVQEIDLGKKRLAYPINHHQYGYYRLLELNSEPDKIAKINELFKLATNALRHQILARPVKSQATVEREQALRARLAAKRQRRASIPETITPETIAPGPTLTPEELEKKIEKILEEDTNI